MRLLLYCGDHTKMSPYHPVDISFPNQIEVKINGDDMKHNFKGLKNKPGSTKPADVTNSLRKKAGYSNQITITYALTSKRYAYTVHMARHVSSDTLIERIRTANVISKQQVLDEMNKANADPDLAATSVRMSLKDPVSTVRISLPVRSTICTHNQCFDGAMFLQLQEQAPQWSCPVCNKTVSFQSLCVDKYFEDILRSTSKSIEKVDIEPNGEWKVIKEEGEEEPNGASNKPRASYDDDFDDDLVDVTEAVNKPVNGVKRESLARDLMSPGMPGSFSFNTPPLSSREASVAQSTSSAQRNPNKRPASAVIDLTIDSDEDDEPPRPAQRQRTSAMTSAPQRNSTSSYNTPASLTDAYQSYPNRQADNYRPTSATAQPRSPQHQRDNYRPVSNAGPAPTSPQNFRLAPPPPQSPSNPHSPARPTANLYGNGNTNSNSSNTWAAQHSRPPSSATHQYQPDHSSPFSNLRPPSQDPTLALQQASEELRLPPMQQYDGFAPSAGGWRSDGSFGGGYGGSSPG